MNTPLDINSGAGLLKDCYPNKGVTSQTSNATLVALRKKKKK